MLEVRRPGAERDHLRRVLTGGVATEVGEALKATGLEAACRLSIYFLFKGILSLTSGGPVSIQLRASSEGLPRPRVARARRETGLPKLVSF